MKIIVFDTETTGLPESRNTSILETDKWPYIVQISWILYDCEKMEVLNVQDHIIRCGVDIPKESSDIHGITNARAERKGVELVPIMDAFDNDLQLADKVVAHNLSFDKRMFMVEAIRNKRKQYFTRNGVRKPESCTMKGGKNLCAIERIGNNGDTYYKYPTLSELHTKLFNYEPKGTHDSMADVLICLRCFCQMEMNSDIIKNDRSLGRIYELYCGNY